MLHSGGKDHASHGAGVSRHWRDCGAARIHDDCGRGFRCCEVPGRPVPDSVPRVPDHRTVRRRQNRRLTCTMGGIKSRPLRVRSSPFLIATAVILIGLAAGVSSQQGPPVATPPVSPAPATLTLVSKEVRRTIPLTVVGDQEFVALDDLASAFQLQLQESLGSMTVGYKGKTIFLTADQPLASVSGRMVSLSAAPTRRGTRWFVPMDFPSRALGLIYDTKLDLRRAAHLLVIGDLRVPRVTVRYDPLGGAGRLTVESTPKVAATVTQDRDRLVVKFDADAIEPPNPPFRPAGPQSLIQGIRLTD